MQFDLPNLQRLNLIPVNVFTKIYSLNSFHYQETYKMIKDASTNKLQLDNEILCKTYKVLLCAILKIKNVNILVKLTINS